MQESFRLSICYAQYLICSRGRYGNNTIDNVCNFHSMHVTKKSDKVYASHMLSASEHSVNAAVYFGMKPLWIGIEDDIMTLHCLLLSCLACCRSDRCSGYSPSRSRKTRGGPSGVPPHHRVCLTAAGRPAGTAPSRPRGAGPGGAVARRSAAR